MTIKEKIKDFQNDFDVHFKQEVERILNEQKSFHPIATEYDESLKKYILDYSNDGKRIRPFLISYFAEKNITEDNILHACLASELFHLAALIHDDIIDESPLRRGVATIHMAADNFKKENKNIGLHMALLMGDIFITASLQHAHTVSSEFFENFSIMIQRTTRGQYLDVIHMNQPVGSISYNEILARHNLKTAWYTFTSPAQLGYCLSINHSDEALDILIPIMRELGLLYQIRDDIIDCTDENSGKPLFGDIFENQTTWVTLYIKQQHPDSFSKIIEAKKEGNIKMLKDIFSQINFQSPYTKEYQKRLDLINNIDNRFSDIKKKSLEILELLVLT